LPLSLPQQLLSALAGWLVMGHYRIHAKARARKDIPALQSRKSAIGRYYVLLNRQPSVHAFTDLSRLMVIMVISRRLLLSLAPLEMIADRGNGVFNGNVDHLHPFSLAHATPEGIVEAMQSAGLCVIIPRHRVALITSVNVRGAF